MPRAPVLARRFLRDERGSALVFVAVMLPVLVGFALLAIDMSRANSLHNDLQKGADAFALAGAAELDGGTGAMFRATAAITNLISNKAQFSTSDSPDISIDDVTVNYLKGLPASDATALGSDGVDSTGVNWNAADDGEARFVEVTIKPDAGVGGFATIFPASFVGGSDSFTLGAQAVAGFGSAVCDYTPMFICNPYSSLEAMQQALSGTQKPMVLLKKQTGGNQAQYGPGNYGYLTTPTDSRQNKDIAEMLAVEHPRACYSDNGINTKPGNIPTLNDAINVRFDIYGNGNTAGYSLTPALNPPAKNVRKGMAVKITGGGNGKGGSCTYEAPAPGQAANYMALPRDNCFASSTCAAIGQAGSRLGDGSWNFDAYWTVNHPGAATDKAALVAQYGANPSRYDVYMYEIAHPILASGPEATAPACNTASADASRRLLYVAVVDCVANPVSGGGGNYPVQVFASMFLTEPAGGPPDADIYAEFVDISSSYGQGTLSKFQRDEAQLYR
jgi:Flp pilus assembly protein TadG